MGAFAVLAGAVAVLALSYGGGAKIEIQYVQLPDQAGEGWSDNQTLTGFAAGECNGKSSCSVNLWVRAAIKADEIRVGYVCLFGEQRKERPVVTVPVKQELAETVLICQ